MRNINGYLIFHILVMLTVLAYNGLQHLSCWQVTGVSVAGSSGHVQLACSLHLQTSGTCSGWQKSHR